MPLVLLLVAAPLAAQTFGSGARVIRDGDGLEGALTSSDPTLDDGSHVDLYRYIGVPGETVVFTLQSDDFDAFMQAGPVTNGQYRLEVSDDDSGGGTNSELTITVGPSGEYAIQANSLSGGSTGRYTLFAESLGGGDVPSTGPGVIRAGETVSGRLDGSDPVLDDGSHYETYAYVGSPGDEISITMRSVELDAFLSGGPLEGDTFEVVDLDDDGAGGTDAQLIVTVGPSGTYGIRANTFEGGQVGAYTLEVESLGSAPVTSSGSGVRSVLEAGDSVSGSLGSGDNQLSDDSYYDLYTYQGAPGEEIEVFMASADFDTYLLGGPSESDAFSGAHTDDDGGGGTNSQLRVTTGSDGRYSIIANAFRPDARGDYQITVRSLATTSNDLPGVLAVGLGETVSGRLDTSDPVLDDGSYYDFYAYTGTPGQDVVITLSSDDFDPYVMLNRVFGGEFESIAQDDDGGPGIDARIRTRIGPSGTYVIVANSFAQAATGAYTLSVDRAQDVADGAADTGFPTLTTGTPAQGRLSTDDTALADESFADLYVFDGTPGDEIAVTLRSTEFDAYLTIGTIEGGDVEVVGRDDDGGGGSDARVRFTVGASGTYAVQANSYGPGETGAYTLTAERLGSSADGGTSAPAPTTNARFAGKWAPVTYDETSSYAAIRDEVQGARRLETVVQRLNAAYPLPQNVSVSFEECGQPNAFYNPSAGAVSFCYEMMDYMSRVLGEQVGPERLTEAIDGAYRFIMLHEVGHALTHQLDLPITGREEDVADQFATLALIRQGDKGAQSAIDGVLALQGRSEFGASDYAGEHSLGPQRLYNVACWVFGSDPDKYIGLVNDDGGLPVARARRCPGEFAQMEKSFDRLLSLVYNE
ncbi:DUF4344 domain-containing metallopeptidase [Rubrivirga sp.]|uniref:DUF4344 domain-containing metallopeptidase n=1 Tax=Rubrivirga sp. TaxID=1885344 RepID=UPI003C738CA9